MALFNLPNSLTLLRILLVPVFTYYFLAGEYRIALAIFVITGLTDVVDGYLARRLQLKTNLGAALDPAADKLLMFVTFIVLAMRDLVPAWLAVLVIFRDLWIIGGLAVIKFSHIPIRFRPSRLSKLTTFFQLQTIFLAFFLTFLRSERPASLMAWEPYLATLLTWVIYAAALLTVASGIHYTRVGWEMYREGKRAALSPEKTEAGRQ
ncbi:MAG TPA: CDP-alcohol phosphatidyltransferase family protein [bacterium]|nr:CDP-alcohol phosphatidyltransferase family protein [bacterium]